MNIADGMGIFDALKISIAGIFVVLIELSIIAVVVICLSKIVKKIDFVKEALNSHHKKTHAQKVVPKTEHKIEKEMVTEEELAAIMISVCKESGLPLDKIVFKSIIKK